jgi:hypothetical protein
MVIDIPSPTGADPDRELKSYLHQNCGIGLRQRYEALLGIDLKSNAEMR